MDSSSSTITHQKKPKTQSNSSSMQLCTALDITLACLAKPKTSPREGPPTHRGLYGEVVQKPLFLGTLCCEAGSGHSTMSYLFQVTMASTWLMVMVMEAG